MADPAVNLPPAQDPPAGVRQEVQPDELPPKIKQRPYRAKKAALAGEEPPPRPKRVRKPRPPRAPKPPRAPRPPRAPVAANIIAEVEREEAEAPMTEKAMLDSMFTRAFQRYANKNQANKGVELMAAVVSKIQSGESFKDLEKDLLSVLSEQRSKTNILQGVMLNHHLELAALFTDMRWHLMRDMWEDLRTQKLHPMERLALLKLACSEAEKAEAYINSSSAYVPATEAQPMLDKADRPSHEKAQVEIRKELEGTTPQGRELIRRMTFKAKERANRLAEEAKKAAKAATEVSGGS